jgi:hypothetical protein
MIDDFFQKKSPSSPVAGIPNLGRALLFRILFYTSLAGFVSGSIFGYLHMKGWIPKAEEGLILYAATFVIGAILSSSFVLYQSRQSQLKTKKIKERL